MNLNDLPDMSEALRQVQMYEKKKLDPVGQEDKDIDNDGDHDKSDSYLLNRRKTVTKAMGKKTHICAKMVKKEGKTYETIPEQHTMLEDGTVTHYDITDGNIVLEDVPVEELEIVIAEMHEHYDNYDKNAKILGEASFTNMLNKAADARGGTITGMIKGQQQTLWTSPTYRAAQGGTPSLYGGAPMSSTTAQGTAPSTALGSGSTPGTSPNTKSPSDVGSTAKPVPKSVDLNKKVKKEAFYFDSEEFEIISEELHLIDEATDEELIEFFEGVILDLAEDFDDLIEICESLQDVEVITEADRYASAVKSSKQNAKTLKSQDKAAARAASIERMKSSAKEAGSRIQAAASKAGSSAKEKFNKAKEGVKTAASKAGETAKTAASKAKEGAKSAGAGAASAAGYTVGTSKRAVSGFKKHFAAGYKRGKEGPSGGSDTSKPDTKSKATKKTDDEDPTGGKLDDLLKSARGTSSGSSSKSAKTTASGGGDSKEQKPSLLKRLGSAVKKGLKRAVGKTARAVSGGSEKLAKRMGEDYDLIAGLYESGLFEIYEIENIVLDETKLGDKAYARAKDLGSQRRRTKEYKQGMNRRTGRREKAMYDLATRQRSKDADLGTQKMTGDTGHHKGTSYADRMDKRKERKED